MRWIVYLLLCIPIGAAADPQPWMKRDNPNTLGLWVYVDEDCPFSEEQIMDDVRGEFLRARLRPDVETSSAALFYLQVNVRCLKDTSNSGNHLGWVSSSSINFGVGIMVWDLDYGSLSSTPTDGGQFIRDSIKNNVGLALTDYLEANFQELTE